MDFSTSDEVYVYFSCRGKMCVKKMVTGELIDPTLNMIAVPLTQADTFCLETGEVKMSFRVKTAAGTVLGSNAIYDEVIDIDDEDEVL